MEQPLVIIVQGSPRTDGNSAVLALDAFEACEAAGFEALIVSSFVLMQEYAHSCNGCMNCLATGDCVFDDGITQFCEMLDAASGLLWITPVYFGSVPGELKALIDRFQVFWSRRKRGEELYFKSRRPASALIVGSGEDPFGTEAVSIPLASASNIAEFTLIDSTVILGIDEADAMTHPDNVDKRNVARDAIDRFIEAVHDWDGALVVEYDESKGQLTVSSPNHPDSAG